MARAEVETKVVYYLDDDDTPYMIRLHVDPSDVTLGDVRSLFVKSNCKCFFKSLDSDYGFVKEEISDDGAKLPSHNGQIVCWLVSTSRSLSDTTSQIGSLSRNRRTSMSPSQEFNLWSKHAVDNTQSVATSDIGSMSFVGSNSDCEERTQLCESVPESNYHVRNSQAGQLKLSRYSSTSDSDISVVIVTVTLSVGASGYLGIGLVGVAHCGAHGSGGVYVGSVVEGGPAHMDGQIRVGDRIIEVNGVSLDGLHSEAAIQTLREAVQMRSMTTLVVAKYQPIGTRSAVSGISFQPMNGQQWRGLLCDHEVPPSTSPWPSTAVSQIAAPLTLNSELSHVAHTMARANSGLNVCNRSWLKMTIPNAFTGSDVIKWLQKHVDGLKSKRDAKQFASKILKAGHIEDLLKKTSFSEKCYYVFEKSVFEGAKSPTYSSALYSYCDSQPPSRHFESLTTRRNSGSVAASTAGSVRYLQHRNQIADPTFVAPFYGDLDSCSVPSMSVPHQHLCTPSLADDATGTSCTSMSQRRFSIPASERLHVIGSV